MKALTAALLGCLFLLSCGSSSSTADKTNERTLKGTWTVEDIDFIGEEGLYKAYMFDNTDSACLRGSEWVFIPNNNTGRFTTNASNSTCQVTSSRMIWSFYETEGARYFQFKYADEKNHPLDKSKTGYRSKIESLSASNMVLRVPSTYEGKSFDVLLKFSKVSDDINL